MKTAVSRFSCKIMPAIATVALAIPLICGSCSDENGDKTTEDEDIVVENGVFNDSRDGNIYGFKTIGTQIWMTRNMAWLPTVVGCFEGKETEECCYVNGFNGTDTSVAQKDSFYIRYGVLYNLNAAKKACPPGWHLPSDDEWKTLEKYLGMTKAGADSIDWRTSGRIDYKLKSVTGWTRYNGDNSTGFNALPGGYRGKYGCEGKPGDCGYFWTSTINSENECYFRAMLNSTWGVYRGSFKAFALSVRCKRN